MEKASRILVKNLIVALTLGVAAVATWAITKSSAPTIEAVTTQPAKG